MAEDQYRDLSTDTKRVEYYNKRVEELRKENPDVAEASERAFDMARQYAQHRVFPPFGFIAFPDDPKNPMGDEMGIGIAAGRVLFGASNFISDLKKEDPGDLIQKGIDSYKGFDDSVAVNELTGATKMSFATVRDGLYEIKSAIRADDKDAEDPFEDNPALKKLTPDEIEALLDSTVIKFVKELGLKRDDARDKTYLDDGAKALSKIPSTPAGTETKEAGTLDPSKLNTKEDPEYMARLEAAKKQDDLMDKLTTGKGGAKIVTETPTKVEEPVKAEPKPIDVTSLDQKASPTPAANTTEKNESAAASPATFKNPDVVNNVTNINTTQEAAVKAEAAPILKSESVQPQTTPATGMGEMESTGSSESPKLENSGGNSVSDDETPLLKMLGESTGMSTEDIAKMFAGNSEGLNTGLDLAFGPGASPLEAIQQSPQSISESVQKSLSTGTQKNINAIQQSVASPASAIATAATKISEPVKMSAPAEPQVNTAEEESNMTPPADVPVQTESMSSGSEGELKESPGQETKTTQETTNNEQSPTNDELLRVMREILKTLQGPLIVTDSSPKFS